MQKMWICLHTCLTIQAVYLELIGGLSAQQFLGCEICSQERETITDQCTSISAGQNSTGSAVEQFSSNKGITLKFTTALAPWQGGVYESLVSLNIRPFIYVHLPTRGLSVSELSDSTLWWHGFRMRKLRGLHGRHLYDTRSDGIGTELGKRTKAIY